MMMMMMMMMMMDDMRFSLAHEAALYSIQWTGYFCSLDLVNKLIARECVRSFGFVGIYSRKWKVLNSSVFTFRA